MQFIKNGPDIPERLLQIHEEGSLSRGKETPSRIANAD